MSNKMMILSSIAICLLLLQNQFLFYWIKVCICILTFDRRYVAFSFVKNHAVGKIFVFVFERTASSYNHVDSNQYNFIF